MSVGAGEFASSSSIRAVHGESYGPKDNGCTVTFALHSIDMCLGIPMQVVAIDGYLARCSAKGVERDVSLFLLQDDRPAIGEYVMVHVGYAIQKMAPHEAR